MRTEYSAFLFILLLFRLSVPAIACCEGDPPGECYVCEDGVWVWDCDAGQNCCGGSCCSNTCCNNICCSAGQNCCGVNCCSNICCNGTCCAAGQICCNGSCCDKVWTKETIDSSIKPCSSCEYIPGKPMCDGTTTELTSYEKCLNVGVGQGQHCQCNSTWQQVGYKYWCRINWDVSKLLWCAAQCVCCVVSCVGPYADPASCAECLCSGQAECCCGICDFVDDCEKNPYHYLPEERLVFSSFGC